MDSPRCETCRFRQPDPRFEYATSGQCRRFPAVPHKIVLSDGCVEWDNLLPWVSPTDWCGEFAPLLPKDKEHG